MLHWMQEVHLGGDVMGSKRGRAARKVMLEQMCVGLLATILLNNAASSAVVETLGQDLVHEPSSMDEDDPYTSAQMHVSSPHNPSPPLCIFFANSDAFVFPFLWMYTPPRRFLNPPRLEGRSGGAVRSWFDGLLLLSCRLVYEAAQNAANASETAIAAMLSWSSWYPSAAT